MFSMESRIVSSLEKGLVTDRVSDHPELKGISVLKGERLDFQLIMRSDETGSGSGKLLFIEVSGAEVKASEVRHVRASLPRYGYDASEEQGLFIRSANDVYPDIIEPLDAGRRIRLREGVLTSVWFETSFTDPGDHTLIIYINEGNETIASRTLAVKVMDEDMPEQSLIFTEWFHNDCLASYYNVPVFSEEHWMIIENFMRCAVRHGINCIMTPVVTPPLDTEVGSERPTVQLVGVTVDDGGYGFDFTLLKRYVDLARACGIRYFEISPLFTQWGAEFAPKVVADVNGEIRRIFGWDTRATTGEYPVFLSHFLPAVRAFFESEGLLGSCRFHVSDEPGREHMENYKKAKSIVSPYLEGCTVIDALSSVELYQSGIVTTPVPAINRIEPFLKEGIKERWAYYCCGQWDRVSNRFIAYPAFRNRIIGVQLYKFNISGFLQWGYNFYYSMGSRRLIDPYIDQSGDLQVPSGDPFSVYPGAGGNPLASTRLAVFYEAIQDYEILKLCESHIGRERTLGLIEKTAGMDITFTEYPKSAKFILDLREEINRVLSGLA